MGFTMEQGALHRQNQSWGFSLELGTLNRQN
jgi:hypothetical protein